MSYSIEILRAADKFLDKLSQQQPSDAEAIEVAIDGLGDVPRPRGCKPLKGYSGIWRIRVGDYRVCYQVDDGELLVLVITISTRDDVYKVLWRYLGH
ncbi:MAG TPA: type II toxin-antitoxin system RelE/ParE family toxin [Aeromicrobium sp.]|nr:type II toxin-antitoxin system RelE/ParE family toxin [Aeromicrobium sp.]